MKTGLFCTYENHHQNAHRAIEEQVKMVQHAEHLGFEEAWITEHHFNALNISPSIAVLMAYLAGVTSTIQLGSAAVLLAFHNPILVAEDIATLDNLCNGRFALGVARGGPFPEQNRHFHLSVSESLPKMLEALTFITQLLYGVDVSFHGKYYHCDRVNIYPKPLQKAIPVYIASGDDQAIEYAATHGFSLMGGPPFSLQRLKSTLEKYRVLNSSGSENLMLTRFFFVAKTNDEALSEALPFIQTFSQKMRANATQMMRHSNKPMMNYEEDYLIENSIIGDVKTCRDKIRRFQEELNLGTLVLKPCSCHLSKNLESLTRYNQEVQSYV